MKRPLISPYQTDPGIEGQTMAGGRVLVNLRGITDPQVMDRAELAALLAAQEKYLGVVTARTVFTAALICRMHRDWLGGLYVWAGRYRTVEMTKGSFRWPPAHLVGQNMATLERETLRPCMPWRGEAMATLARVQAELLLVHPFREGNGRTARWVTDLMVQQAGFPPLDYGFTRSPTRRKAYLEAVLQGYAVNYEPLARVLEAALRRALARKPRAPSK